MSSLFGIAAGGTADFYGFEIENSLRFDDSSSSRLSPTSSFGTPTNTDIATISVWVKRADLSGVNQQIVGGYDGSSGTASSIYFDTSNRLHVAFGGGSGALTTNAVFRDTSSWYHIHVLFDSTQSTSTDRCKIYVNGQQITSFSSSSYPNQNQDNHFFSSGTNHRIGSNFNNSGNFFDGYMAEFNGIDGTALDPTNFGETKSGVWIPKDTSGLTFGNNGYRLQFGDSSAIGDDTSGNGNDWTATGLSAHDVVPDSPTNNFATLNPQIGRALSTYVDPRHGNLEVDTANSGRGTTFSTMAMPTGTGEKYYAEYRYRADDGLMRVGIISVDQANDYLETNNFDSPTTDNVSYTSSTGKIAVNGAQQEVVATYSAGDVIGMAVDLENGTIQFSKNGSNVGSAVSQSFISSNEMLFAAGDSSNSKDIRYSANFGQDSTFAGDETAATNTDTNGIGAFHSAVPSGFKALCAKNLPEPTFSPKDNNVPEDYFNTVLYSGNSSTQSITGVGFQPDWVWLKNRTGSNSNILVDSVRGSGSNGLLYLLSNGTNAEIDGTNVTSLDSDGFTLGSNSGTNGNGSNFVSWNWLAGGTAVSNTDGSVTSSVSVNSEAGFSIVSFTSPASGNFTAGHGLGVTPEVIIQKERGSTGSWHVWHESVTTTTSNFLKLETTGGVGSVSNVWGASVPNSTTFGLGVGVSVDGNNTQIAYCFHSVEGYSKFGNYTGNGNADGTYVYTGFRPAWVLFKCSNTTGNWILHDTSRNPSNLSNLHLRPNSSNSEDSGTNEAIDILSNGFKHRGVSNNNANSSNDTYIYLAFAEMPFKYANAR